MIGESLILLIVIVVALTGVVLASFGLTLWVLRQNISVRDHPSLWTDRAYSCPDCGAAMEPGWTRMGRGAVWSPKKRGRPSMFTGIGDSLTNTISGRIPPGANMSWHCRRCELLLVDHSKLVN